MSPKETKSSPKETKSRFSFQVVPWDDEKEKGVHIVKYFIDGKNISREDWLALQSALPDDAPSSLFESIFGTTKPGFPDL